MKLSAFVNLLLLVCAVSSQARRKTKLKPSVRKLYHVNVNKEVMWPNQDYPADSDWWNNLSQTDVVDTTPTANPYNVLYTEDFFPKVTQSLQRTKQLHTATVKPTYYGSNRNLGTYEMRGDEKIQFINDINSYRSDNLALEPSIDTTVKYYDRPGDEYFYYEPCKQAKSTKSTPKFLFLLPLAVAYYQFLYFLLSSSSVSTVTSVQTSLVSVTVSPVGKAFDDGRDFLDLDLEPPPISTTTEYSTRSVFITLYSTVKETELSTVTSTKTKVSLSPTTIFSTTTLKTTETDRLSFTVTSVTTSTTTLQPDYHFTEDYNDASGDVDSDYGPLAEDKKSYEAWIKSSVPLVWH